MRRSTRTLTAATASLGLAVTCLLGNAPPASAEPECLTSSSDFDRDGTPDVTVGIPGGSGRNGAVQVRLSNKGKPFTTTVTGAPGFGTAVTSLSSYTDEGDDALCSQLVVGSPDESLRTDLQRSGVVYVSPGVPRRSGSCPAPPSRLQAPSSRTWRSPVPGSAPPWPPSSVPPTRSTRGRRGSSWGHRDWTSTTAGTPARSRPSGSTRTRIPTFMTSRSPGSVSHSPMNPHRGPPSARRSRSPEGRWRWACPASRLRTRRVPVPSWSTTWTPTPTAPSPWCCRRPARGVPGTAEKGDRFGTSVHLVPARGGGAPTLLVGTPGEDVGSTKDAGSVTVARISSDLRDSAARSAPSTRTRPAWPVRSRPVTSSEPPCRACSTDPRSPISWALPVRTSAVPATRGWCRRSATARAGPRAASGVPGNGRERRPARRLPGRVTVHRCDQAADRHPG